MTGSMHNIPNHANVCKFSTYIFSADIATEMLKLESLNPKFASEKFEPENVSELSDEELSRLGLTTIVDRMALFSRGRSSTRKSDRGGKSKISARRT